MQYTPATPNALLTRIKSTPLSAWLYIMLVLLLAGLVAYLIVKNF
jgi:hypothetical protein